MSFVTNVSSTLKQHQSSTQIVTPEEAKQRKFKMLSIVDIALDRFTQNLSDGKVKLDSSLDLERLVKLSLILAGEADSITGKPVNQSEQIELSDMSRVEDILSDTDPEVRSLFEKLYQGYNRLNDTD